MGSHTQGGATKTQIDYLDFELLSSWQTETSKLRYPLPLTV